MPALVTFTLGQQTYCLPIADVQEVLRMVAMTPLPDAPPEVLGAINVRGVPVLVLDLRQRLGLPGLPPTPASPLLLVRLGDKRLALLVDRVKGVVQAPAMSDATGLVRLGDDLGVLLRPDSLLTASVRLLLVESHGS